MPVTVKRKNSILTAFIKGEIDHHTAPEIRESIDDAFVTAGNTELLVLDFSDVTFMDSSGIGLIMGRYRLASGYGARVTITEASGYIKRVIKIAGLDSIVSLNQNTDTQLSNKEETKIEK